MKASYNTAGGGSSRSGSICSGKNSTSSTVDLNSPRREHCVWTLEICRHAKSGQGREALHVYEKMRESGVKPSSYTFVAALKACRSLKDVKSARQLHAEVVESGLEAHVYVGTMLVDVYAKCGSIVEARSVFEKMPHRNVISWNAMILGYAQMGAGKEALQLYVRMQHEGVASDNRTFVGALKACCTLAVLCVEDVGCGVFMHNRCLEQVRAIHSHAVKSGFESDVYVGTMLVNAYAKCRSLVDARSVFEKVPHRDLVFWSAMITGYVEMDKGEIALQLYTRMQQEGMIPDNHIFVAALKACSSLATPEAGSKGQGKIEKQCLGRLRAIHSDIVKQGSESALHVGTMLVDVYVKCGSLVDARRVFDKISGRDVVSWNTMILGYAQWEQGEEALHLYARMQQEHLIPDEGTFLGALKAHSSLASGADTKSDGALVKEECLEQVRAVHLHIVKSGLQSDVRVATMLVDAYAKCGSLVDARRVFEEMPRHDVVSWTALIAGYVQLEEGEEALELYAQMQQEGVVPNDRTFVAAIKACGIMAALEKGKEIHSLILHTGLGTSDSFVAASLIDMYGKCGSMEDAQKVFDGMLTRNTVVWSSLIAGYAYQGEGDHVFDLFERMRAEGVNPDSITFLSVLTVCSHVGLVAKGQYYLEAMSRDYGISPSIDHYTCMVDLLGRAGEVHQAMGLVKTLQPSVVVLKCLLAACQKWGQVELAIQVFDCAVKLDRRDGALYILMSNIYLAADMLEDAQDVQEQRVKAQAWKQAGHSRWTDMGGNLHAFAVGTADTFYRKP